MTDTPELVIPRPGPAPLHVKLHSRLVEHGGHIERPDLIEYLAEVLHVDDIAVRDEIIVGVTEGRYTISWVPTVLDGTEEELADLLDEGEVQLRLSLPGQF